MFAIKNSMTLLLLIISSVYSVYSYGAPAVGKVIASSGQVSTSSQRTLSRRSDVYSGDTIITGSSGQVQIQFTDGTLMSLPANTRYRIDHYQYTKAKPTANEHKGSLIEGGLQTLTGEIVKSSPRAYQIRSNIATIGIRGTFVATALVNNTQVIGVWNGTADFKQNACGNAASCTIAVGDQGRSNFAVATTDAKAPTVLQKAPKELAKSAGNGQVTSNIVAKSSDVTRKTEKLNLRTPEDLTTQSAETNTLLKDNPFEQTPQQIPLAVPPIFNQGA